LTRIKYDETTLKYIPLFETLTGAKVKDCIIDDKVIFIIEKGNMGLAIGRNGTNLKRVENTIKKPLKIVEFDDDVTKFIRNFVFPLRMFEIQKEDKKVTIKGNDTKTKGLLIGRERVNLKRLISTVKRFFDIDDIIVI
jgi:transcription termination/antitermination protein NusA